LRDGSFQYVRISAIPLPRYLVVKRSQPLSLMYTFSQSSGLFQSNGVYIAQGWAGQGPGRNNPAMQGVHNIGPLPRGRYTIGPAYMHPRLGPVVMNLTPDPANNMLGRSAFRIHGAALKNTDLSSEGCIVLDRRIRERIRDGADRDLEVV
jgi:hypothetical protein